MSKYKPNGAESQWCSSDNC